MKRVGLIIIIFLSCSKHHDSSILSDNENRIENKTWKVYDYRLNGVIDNGPVADQTTFQFNSNGKMYFSQLNPVFRDTLLYIFTDANDIKLTRPSTPSYVDTLVVRHLTDTDFEFDLTDNQNPSQVNSYRTAAQ